MIGQSLSNTNETCYNVHVRKIYNLNKALLGKEMEKEIQLGDTASDNDLLSTSDGAFIYLPCNHGMQRRRTRIDHPSNEPPVSLHQHHRPNGAGWLALFSSQEGLAALCFSFQESSRGI